MNLKKRTQEQIDYSTYIDKDFTGGYNYAGWLLHLRKTEFIVTMGLLFAGILCFFTLEDSYDYNFQIGAGVACVAASVLINILLKRSYSSLKKGVSK